VQVAFLSEKNPAGLSPPAPQLRDIATTRPAPAPAPRVEAKVHYTSPHPTPQAQPRQYALALQRTFLASLPLCPLRFCASSRPHSHRHGVCPCHVRCAIRSRYSTSSPSTRCANQPPPPFVASSLPPPANDPHFARSNNAAAPPLLWKCVPHSSQSHRA
jgi:hypothetical protein